MRIDTETPHILTIGKKSKYIKTHYASYKSTGQSSFYLQDAFQYMYIANVYKRAIDTFQNICLLENQFLFKTEMDTYIYTTFLVQSLLSILYHFNIKVFQKALYQINQQQLYIFMTLIYPLK